MHLCFQTAAKELCRLEFEKGKDKQSVKDMAAVASMICSCCGRCAVAIEAALNEAAREKWAGHGDSAGDGELPEDGMEEEWEEEAGDDDDPVE